MTATGFAFLWIFATLYYLAPGIGFAVLTGLGGLTFATGLTAWLWRVAP